MSFDKDDRPTSGYSIFNLPAEDSDVSFYEGDMISPSSSQNLVKSTQNISQDVLAQSPKKSLRELRREELDHDLQNAQARLLHVQKVQSIWGYSDDNASQTERLAAQVLYILHYGKRKKSTLVEEENRLEKAKAQVEKVLGEIRQFEGAKGLGKNFMKQKNSVWQTDDGKYMSNREAIVMELKVPNGGGLTGAFLRLIALSEFAPILLGENPKIKSSPNQRKYLGIINKSLGFPQGYPIKDLLIYLGATAEDVNLTWRDQQNASAGVVAGEHIGYAPTLFTDTGNKYTVKR